MTRRSRFEAPLDLQTGVSQAQRAGIPCKVFVVDSKLPRNRSRVDRIPWVGQILLLTSLYYAGGRVGLELTHYHENVTLVWPPTGISLAALLMFGVRLWPGVFIGALLVTLGSQPNWLPSLGIAIGNTLEAVIGVTLLIHVAGLRLSLVRQRDVASFLLIGVLGCTIIGATIGTGVLVFFGSLGAADYWQVWLIWWLGDAGGALILTPILMITAIGVPSWSSLGRRIESWFALAAALATILFAFFGPELGLLGFGASVAPFPVLIWAGTRLGPRGAAVVSFVVVLIAILATGTGTGPFVLGTTTESMFLLWSYATFMGITAFTLATVVTQRDVAEQRYRSQEAERLGVEKQKLLMIERERLTREMHDGLGGQIVSVLSMVERGMAAPDEVAEALRRAIDDIRIVIDSLDPNTTDLSTSLGKLRARLEPLLRRNGINFSWSLDDIPDLDSFPPEAALHVLRIIQEAVTNTLRHANADSVEVRISSVGDGPRRLRVSIRDDGNGLPTGMTSGGRGIGNMKSRAEELGGVLGIEDTSSGTKINLEVPIPC